MRLQNHSCVLKPAKPINPAIPKKLHCLWLGKEAMPRKFNKNFEKWVKLLGPEWSVKLWSDSDLNENNFSREVIKKVQAAKFGIQKADILRYHIMRQEGGWYFDLDFIPFNNLDAIARTLHAEELICCNEDEGLADRLSNGFFACTKEHPAISQLALAVLNQPLNTQDFNMQQIIEQTGPIFFKKQLINCKITHLPPRLFYPIYFSERKSGKHFAKDSVFACHEWNQRYFSKIYNVLPEKVAANPAWKYRLV